MIVAAVNWAPDVAAFMGGVGVGLCVFFITLLLTLGVAIVRSMLNG